MSKILFTVAFYHDGHSRRPQFIVSTNNLYSVQVKGANFKGAKIGNSNLGNGFRNRFEYSVSGGKAQTRLSLVMNTSAILPHMTWASPHPNGPPTGKGPRGPPGQDDQTLSRPSQSSSQSSSGRSRRRRRRPHAVDDGAVSAGDDAFDGDGGGGYD